MNRLLAWLFNAQNVLLSSYAVTVEGDKTIAVTAGDTVTITNQGEARFRVVGGKRRLQERIGQLERQLAAAQKERDDEVRERGAMIDAVERVLRSYPREPRSDW